MKKGSLSSLTSQRLKIELGAFVGLSLAQVKAAQPSAAVVAMPDLSSGFLERTETVNTREAAPRGVFLVHHESAHRDVVRRFVEDDCGLQVYELNSSDISSRNFKTVLGEQMRKCSFAICLLNKNEPMADGRLRANQNIVYQAGFFQGRYGFERVALLAEEGCDAFANIAGIVRLDFPAAHVNSTFIDLRRMLQREGLMRAGKRSDA